MVGIGAFVIQDAADQAVALVGGLVVDEGRKLVGRREQADHVEEEPAGEGRVVDRGWGRDAPLRA